MLSCPAGKLQPAPMSPAATVHEVLGRDGVLSRRLTGFRERPQQLAMAKAVARAFDRPGHLLVEAPTGVGKSLGYLVPAILGPVAARRKVVVVTHTIALQDQLLEKDLPLLSACLPIEFAAVKAVGRQHHLGLRRLGLALDRGPGLVKDDPEMEALRRIARFAESASDGLRQEMRPAPPLDLWELVNSESDNCLGARCRTFDACFYQRARLRLKNADVVVANHALYVLDLVLRQVDASVLPDHDAVIIDEAHHLEDVASEHFGLEVSLRSVSRLVSRIAGRSAGPRSITGILDRTSLPGREEALQRAEQVRAALREFFDQVVAWCAERPGGNGRLRDDPFVPDVLSGPLEGLAECLREMHDRCVDESLQAEFDAFFHRSAGQAAAVRAILERKDPGLVHYVEDAFGRNPRIVARPLEVAPLLAGHLFAKVKSVVLTSATLAADRTETGLRSAAKRLGCEAAEHLVLDSPFDHARRMRVHVPEGIPLPDDPEHLEHACAAVRRLVSRSGGGAFMLFTSFKSLEAFRAALEPEWTRQGLLVLAQGPDSDRTELLRRFREDGSAILFGADSFWQGVDVPGPALRLVIIARLPFPVPTHPHHEARAELIKSRGGNPFFDHFLPEALIRWRQGFGRLIRTEDDEGIVACLDRRIVERRYGARFRSAVPECPWTVEESVPDGGTDVGFSAGA